VRFFKKNRKAIYFACPQPGQAGTKKVIIHRRVRRVRREVFFYSKPGTVRKKVKVSSKGFTEKAFRFLMQISGID
jgi:hypothetical protein